MSSAAINDWTRLAPVVALAACRVYTAWVLKPFAAVNCGRRNWSRIDKIDLTAVLKIAFRT